VSLPVLQVVAAGLNFLFVVFTGRGHFTLPFKSIDDVWRPRISRRERVAKWRVGGPMKRAALLALALAVGAGCKPSANSPPPRSTLVVGLDISGSFRKSGQFDDAMRYAALYIYGHINALGGLKQATDVFCRVARWRARRTAEELPPDPGPRGEDSSRN